MEAEQVYEEARSLMAERRFAEGLEKMRALVDANPDDPDIQMHYGEALIAAGQPSLAVWPLSRAMCDPDHLVPAGLLLARAQVWAGSAADAIQTATRVLDADAENKDALLIRIEANLRENMEERALEDLDRAEHHHRHPRAVLLHHVAAEFAVVLAPYRFHPIAFRASLRACLSECAYHRTARAVPLPSDCVSRVVARVPV